MKDEDFNAVKTMRRIRDRLSETYSDESVEERDLEAIRKKYDIKT